MRVRCWLAVVLALVAGGCGSERVISKEELEKSVNDALVNANRKPENVDCADAVKAQAAEAVTCVATVAGADFRVNVVVMSVDGDRATYDIDVEGQPIP